jgi:hypothetical protein
MVSRLLFLMVAYLLMPTLSLFKQERHQGRDKKKRGPKPPWDGEGKGRGGASHGKMIAMPMFENKPIACPCGRVYVLPSALGGYLLFDSEGELGDSLLPLGDLDNGPSARGPYRFEILEKAHGILHREGCKVHEGSYLAGKLEAFQDPMITSSGVDLRRLVVHWKRDPYDIYIGRPTIWGNKYSHQSDTQAEFRVGTREEAIAAYERWLLSEPVMVAMAKRDLRGKVLGCWCRPKLCHGDVLARIANSDD